MMHKGEKSGQFDVVIVGGGPGGMAAALWCHELGLTSCLIDSASNCGGQLHWIHNPITNYLGGRFDNGTAALRAFSASLSDRRFTQMLALRVTEIDRASMSVSLDDGRDISAKAIVVATGIRRRQLNVPGEAEFKARGILDSGSRDKSEVSGKTAAVIGGGDAALENALILADYAEKVYLVHRRNEFSGRREFIQAVKHSNRIESIMNAQVKEFGGSSQLEFVDLELTSGNTQRIPIANAVVRIGVQPNSELLKDIADLDDAGYVNVDREGRTSVANIYAIGDIAHPTSPTIATAIGSAAAAIKSVAAHMRKTE
ncbi:MAG TPA: NAD(P)/FAD-dependent oxidoreductase [Pyrinomonadaceae bacterium]|nr:NAD(P)/FAD-dependent oxidoreductase [Pyrinomonadaceae bacterium]